MPKHIHNYNEFMAKSKDLKATVKTSCIRNQSSPVSLVQPQYLHNRVREENSVVKIPTMW